MTVKTAIGEITANEVTLDLIYTLAFEAERNLKSDDRIELTCIAKKVQDQIYEALNNSGYYGEEGMPLYATKGSFTSY